MRVLGSIAGAIIEIQVEPMLSGNVKFVGLDGRGNLSGVYSDGYTFEGLLEILKEIREYADKLEAAIEGCKGYFVKREEGGEVYAHTTSDNR